MSYVYPKDVEKMPVQQTRSSTGSVNVTPIPRTSRTSAHVNFSRVAQVDIGVSQNSHLHI